MTPLYASGARSPRIKRPGTGRTIPRLKGVVKVRAWTSTERDDRYRRAPLRAEGATCGSVWLPNRRMLNQMTRKPIGIASTRFLGTSMACEQVRQWRWIGMEAKGLGLRLKSASSIQCRRQVSAVRDGRSRQATHACRSALAQHRSWRYLPFERPWQESTWSASGSCIGLRLRVRALRSSALSTSSSIWILLHRLRSAQALPRRRIW